VYPSSFVRLLRLACVSPALLLACSALPAQTPNDAALSYQAQQVPPTEAQLPRDLPRKPSPAVAPNRITEAIDPSRVQPLPHHLPLWANPQNNIGPASSQLALTMVLSRAPQQQSALEQLLGDQKNPSSSHFHSWLTPEEMGQQFGLSDADIEALKSWIESQGLQVKWVSPSRTFIGFGGPAASVGRAFGTEIHNYRVNGADRVSVSSDPMIPAAMVPVIKSIYGLYTIEDRPFHTGSAPQTARPDLTASDGSHFMAPADFNTIYDETSSYNGSQQTIAIVGRSRTDFADFSNFRQLTLASFENPIEIVPTALGGIDPGPALTAPPAANISIEDQLEATLDVMRAGAVAPGASLLLVVATSASGGIGVDTQYLVQTTPLPAQIVNISFGACESAGGPSGVSYWDTLFQQAAAEGISVFVASGDSGASGCETYFSTPSATPPAISPNYICSSSYATCVGGTEFNDTASPGTYWNTTNSFFLASALSYIPEGGWNEPTDSNGATQLASSGGGVSTIIPTPSWQTGTGVPSARTGRYTPDLSFSSSCHDGYFGCFAAAGSGCQINNGFLSFEYFCGTSAAAPDMAGVTALLNQKLGYPVGNINPEIYAMGQNQPTSFHDATPVTSGVATCDINTPSRCNNSTPGPTALTGGQAGYPLTTGYDLVTGVGSPDIANFLTNFAAALQVPTVTVTPSLTTSPAGRPLSFTVTVAGASGQPTPTGTISLSWLYNSPTPHTATLVNGVAAISIPTGVLSGGPAPITFTAEYTPDSASVPVYSSATGTCQVNITLFTPTVTTTFSPKAPTTAQDVMVTVTLNGGTGNPVPTGSVQVESVNPTAQIGQLAGGAATVTIPAGTLPPGSDSFSILYTPDYAGAVYFASTITSASLTVTAVPKTTPTLTVTPSVPTITLADPLTLAVKVAGTAPGSPAATGSGTVTANGRTLLFSIAAGNGTIALFPGWLQVGSNSLAISYSGDNNYNPATAPLSLQVGKAVMAMTVLPNPTSVTSAQSLQVIVNFTGFVSLGPSPTGTVTLTSGSYTSAPTTLNSPTNIIVPAGALPVGTDPLAVTYSGDSNYAAVSTTGSVVITAPPPPPPSFTVGATAVTISAPGATTGNSTPITVTPAGGFTGSVTLTASLTTSPSGAQHLPTLSFGPTSPVSVTSGGAATATLTVATTAPTTGALVQPVRPQTRWYPLAETALACVVLFGFGGRRRSWRIYIGMLLMLVAVSSAVAACGGGGSSVSTPTPTPTPGTTPGSYVVTVTGTSGGIAANTSLSLVVQ
jgi:subtilase family serine protease